MTPRLEVAPGSDDHFIMRVDYRAVFLDNLKENVWWQCRDWDKGQNAWVVHMDHYEECVRLLKRHFGGVDIQRSLIPIVKRYNEFWEEAVLVSSDL